MQSLMLSLSPIIASVLPSVRSSSVADLHLLPIFHWYPDTLESQDISGPIKIGDTWHVFVDCIPEGETTEVIGPQVGLGPLQWCHFSSTDLVHWSAHPIAIRNDRDFDGAIIDTGSTFQHPNGTVLAIYATANRTSLKHTFDGDVCIAVAEDHAGGLAGGNGLLRWRKACDAANGRIVNPTCAWCRQTCPDSCRQNENSTAPSPFPGIIAAMGHRDPTAPWLDKCAPSSPALCWYVLVGSGGRLDEGGPVRSVATLWRTDYNISTRWDFVSLFWDSPGGLYSCPDFFAIPQTDLVVFSSLDQHYFVGTYGVNATSGVPTLSAEAPPSSQMTAGEIWKTAGEGANNALNKSSRRILWGAIRIHTPMPNINPMSAFMHYRGSTGGEAPSVVSLPRDLTLLPGSSPPRLSFAFVPELEALRGDHRRFEAPVAAGMLNASGRALEIFAVFAPVAEQEPPASSPFGISVLVGGTDQKGTDIGYDSTSSAAFLGGLKAPLSLGATEALRLHVYVDACLVEVIANNQTLLSAQVVTPDASFDGLAVFGPVGAQSIDVWGMTGIWRRSKQ